MKINIFFLMLATLAFSALGLQTLCVNDTYTYVSSSLTNITISNVYYQNAINSIQGTFSNSFSQFTTQVLYSLTPFPNSVQFSCPQSRYKGLSYSQSSSYYYYRNFTITVEKFLYYSQDFYFNQYSNDIYDSFYLISKNQMNYTLVKIPDWVNLLPSDCAKVGIYDFIMNTTVLVKNISMDVNQTNYFTCNIKNDDCGTLITPLYNTSCCYYNSIGYNTTFIKKSLDIVMNPDGISCLLPFQWGIWQILVITFSCLIIAILAIVALGCLCKVGGSFLSV